MTPFRPSHDDLAALGDRARVAAASAQAAILRSTELHESAAAAVRRGYTLECAWCGRQAGVHGFLDTPAFGQLHRRVTHGICPSCLAALRRDGRSV